MGHHEVPSSKCLDPHEAPPQELKDIYKSWTSAISLTPERLQKDVLDAAKLPRLNGISREQLGQHFREFLSDHETQKCVDVRFMGPSISNEEVSLESIDPKISSSAGYDIKNIPGLVIFPSLLPADVQQSLLSVLLHQELSNPENQTNLHSHYRVSYPQGQESFFSADPDASVHLPKDPGPHKPLTNRSLLEKNLHWVTLGGQYNWTKKEYPTTLPPRFPVTVGKLIGSLFPEMKPQAAILNVYSPKDKLSLHRDVSEEVDRGLVSISLGCSCVFVVGIKNEATKAIQHETIVLKSGDVLYMSGASRYAWHGVPKIIPDTCPTYLQAWPGERFPNYDGWMMKRRINLNVRQMF